MNDGARRGRPGGAGRHGATHGAQARGAQALARDTEFPDPAANTGTTTLTLRGTGMRSNPPRPESARQACGQHQLGGGS